MGCLKKILGCGKNACLMLNLPIIAHCILLQRCVHLKLFMVCYLILQLIMPLSSSEKLNFDAKQRAELMLKMHETIKENIECMNDKYKISGDKGRKQLNFEPSDLVWLHLRKEQFPDLRKSKLMSRADGPFKVLEKINENAYKLDLSADFGVSPTFNIVDLKPYLGEEDALESRMTQIQEGEDAVDINTSDTSTPTHNQISGPITRAHARQLNN
jgi:hypothetical protein